MIRISTYFLMTMIALSVYAQEESMIEFKSYVESQRCQDWIITASEDLPEVRASLSLIVHDACEKISAARTELLARSDDPLDMGTRLGPCIVTIRAIESEAINNCQLLIEAERLQQLRSGRAMFEYDRIRSYCDQMNFPHSLPDLESVVDAASIDFNVMLAQAPPASIALMVESIDIYWQTHLAELANGNNLEQTHRQLSKVGSAGVIVLRDSAKQMGVDLESVHAALLCEAYPVLCMRTPVDAAYDGAAELIQEVSKEKLGSVYEEYRATRSTLRAMFAEAQQRWDQPEDRRRRELKFRELKASGQTGDKAWEKHPGEFALRELFKLECDTVALIRSLVPEESLERSPPATRFALEPLDSR